MSRTVTPLSQIDTRAPEAGRIRLGVKTERAMKSIDTFRFTSPLRRPIEQLAARYGGTVSEWNDSRANPSRQWQVITTTNEIRVLLLPGGFSSWYELWTAGGCERRCDGEVCAQPQQRGPDIELVDVPCICDRAGVMQCKPYSRLTVLLPDIDFVGTWRLESKGKSALQELPGMHNLILQFAQQGRLPEAQLHVERRERMTMGKKRNYVAPRLTLPYSLDDAAALEAAPGRPGALPGESLTALPSGAPTASGAANPEILDAEVVDDELLEIERKLRADALNFGLDPEAYVDGVRTMTQDDRARMNACIDKVRAGVLEPIGFNAGRPLFRTISPT